MRSPSMPARPGWLPDVSIPASFFGIVLGVIALGSDWRAAAELWNLPRGVGEAIMLLGVAIWGLLVAMYAAKWAWHRDDALAEAAHPIQCCFIGLVPVSTLLVSTALLPYSRAAAIGLFALGATGSVAFSVWRHGGLWKGGRDPSTTTPVLYLPAVAGNFVTATAAGALGWTAWGQLFFGAGLFAWLALESVILHRLLVADPLAVPLRPTLGIHLAPPAVGLVAYMSVTNGDPGFAAQMLVGYALLQGLIVLRLLPWIRQQPFAPSYWALTFGIGSLSLGAEHMVTRGVTGPVGMLAPLLFVVSNLVIGSIAIGSIIQLARGKLLPPVAGRVT
jgi:tellurite resistance protein